MTTSEAKPDYKSTVLTPKTDFPQRGSLSQKEPQILAQWEEMKLDQCLEEERRGAPSFLLHDGPPYANGHIHLGHALNKTLKDIIVRYKTLAGFRCKYVPGFDCHGLPIEQRVLTKLREEKKTADTSPLAIRKQAAETARYFMGEQTKEFQRLGIGGDWANPYVTMDPDYEVAILGALRDLVAKGYVYKALKPVYWDPVYETALAEAEIEYNEEHVSPQIYLRFPLAKNQQLPEALRGVPRPTLVIWTTTPWTLPANLGVSVAPTFEYALYRRGEETLLIAEALLPKFKEVTNLTDGEVVGRIRGQELDRLQCEHPVFPGKTSLVLVGEHVTLDAGTGAVHTAPAHGADDFAIGARYGLGVFNPVDEKGRYTDAYPEMQGVSVFEANKKIIEKFRAEGSLIWTGNYHHSYPYSWRSHLPVIMRATEQWFMNLTDNDLRERALAEIERVQWIPAWGQDRIQNMVAGRPDWCLSRQRSWGVPIPSLLDTQTGQSLLTPEIIEQFMAIVAKEGTDAWYERPAEDFLPASLRSGAAPGRYQKEYNVLDVWFDSGASHLGCLEARPDLSWPADLYLEGSDQHRGWFQHSLWVAIGTKGKAPFRAVLTHGFILDEKGQPMSKSLGNVIPPQDVIEEMGADVLRLWVASEDYRGDLKASKGLLQQVSGVYRTIRNTLRYLLGVTSDYQPGIHVSADTESAAFLPDDRWLLLELNDLVRAVRKAYDSYEFHRVYHLINGFCTVQLSRIYLDCAKDRLYCDGPESMTRRACQAVCHAALHRLARMLAPILPFTTEEAWGHMPKGNGEKESVHLTLFPEPVADWDSGAEELRGRWEKLLALRAEQQRLMEPLRRDKVIGNTLGARVTLRTEDPATLDFLTKEADVLPRLFIVGQVLLERMPTQEPAEALVAKGLTLDIEIRPAPGVRCERCWTVSEAVGGDPSHPDLCPRCATVMRSLTNQP